MSAPVRSRRAALALPRGAVLLALGSLAACSPEPAPPAVDGPPRGAAVPEEVVEIAPVPGTTIDRPAAAGEVHRYRIRLEPGRTVEVVAEQNGADLELAVFESGGGPLAVADRVSAPGGVERARWSTETAGAYALEVRTWSAVEAASYRLTLEALRPTTAADRGRSAADRRFAEAEALRAREDRESCRRAVELYLEARELARGLGDRRREAEVLQRLGWVHRKYLEDKPAAAGYYTGALELFEALGEEDRAASVLNNLGRVRFDLGELAGAVDAWNRALALGRRLGDTAGEAYSLGNLALAHRYRGEIHAALDAYDRSLELLRAAGDREAEGRALNNRGRFYRLLGERDQALADLEAALAIARETGDRRLEAAVLTAIGGIQEHRGAFEASRVALERALALRSETGDRRGRAVSEHALGSLYARLGRHREAAALERRALAGFRRLGAVREEADALLALGRLALASGRPREALTPLGRALAGFRAIRDPFGAVATLVALARSRRAHGDPRAALASVEEALREVETVRARLGSHSLRASFLAARHEHYDLHVDLLMDLHRLEPGAGHDRAALAASERARVRSLLDLLAESGLRPTAGVAPDLLARELELERRLAVLEQERLGLGGGAPPERLAAVERALAELVREHRAVRGRIRAARRTALAEPRTLEAGEIQRLLDPGTLLLEIHLGEPASFLWMVTADSLRSFELPGRAVLEAAARRAHELLAVSHLREYRRASEGALAALSSMLLAPIADRLAGERLLVSVPGALRIVPFAALPVPGDAGGEPLVRRHEIVALPSASALVVLRERTAGRPRPAGTVAVLADPVFAADDPRLGAAGVSQSAVPGAHGRTPPLGAPARAPALPAASRWTAPVPGTMRGEETLRRLRFSADEAAAILRLAPSGSARRVEGFDATREAVLDPALARFRILHLATHGSLDDEHPELTRLDFSRFGADGRRREGALLAHEIYDLDLPVELVVLSACETALGEPVRGEGLVGLTQGFFHAGAERVLVSLWRVDDRATAELMARFYEAHLVEGLRPPAALRRAQLAVASEAGWRAPYYWAGFVLEGEWR